MNTLLSLIVLALMVTAGTLTYEEPVVVDDYVTFTPPVDRADLIRRIGRGNTTLE
jgi:hypothetical protein